jgi:hypothetical protein
MLTSIKVVPLTVSEAMPEPEKLAFHFFLDEDGCRGSKSVRAHLARALRFLCNFLSSSLIERMP